MPNWFDFAGVRSTSLGVCVVEYPALTRAAERSTFQTLPGRSGSLTMLEGANVYDDIVLSIQCYIRDGYSVDAACAWLRGSGVLVLGNTPDRSYKARVTNQLDMAVIIRNTGYRSFNAVFRCAPYRYIYPAPAAQTFTASPGSINNPGTADAVPQIAVVGSGDIDLTIGGRTIHIDGLASSITIDCETGMAYNGSTDLTSKVTLDYYPWVIPPGISAVSWTGTVTSVTVSRPWRYI